MDVLALEARLLGDGEVWEESDEDDKYVRHASNNPQLYFHVVVDCHEGYMLILCPRDETC